MESRGKRRLDLRCSRNMTLGRLGVDKKADVTLRWNWGPAGAQSSLGEPNVSGRSPGQSGATGGPRPQDSSSYSWAPLSTWSCLSFKCKVRLPQWLPKYPSKAFLNLLVLLQTCGGAGEVRTIPPHRLCSRFPTQHMFHLGWGS